MSFGRGTAKTSCGGGGNIGSPTRSNISSRSRVTTTPRSSSFCPRKEAKTSARKAGRDTFRKCAVVTKNNKVGPTHREGPAAGRVDYSNHNWLTPVVVFEVAIYICTYQYTFVSFSRYGAYGTLSKAAPHHLHLQVHLLLSGRAVAPASVRKTPTNHVRRRLTFCRICL